MKSFTGNISEIPCESLAYFDIALLINLDKDRVELAEAKKMFDSVGIRFERFPALSPPTEAPTVKGSKEAGYFGCALSHRAALQHILDKQYKHALIFEDDVVFRSDVREQMNLTIDELEGTNWGIFYLGLKLLKAGPVVSSRLGRVISGCHTHAYAVSLPAVPKLISAIDKFLETGLGWFDAYDDMSIVKLYSRESLAVQGTRLSATEGEVRSRFQEELRGLDLIRFFSKCSSRDRLRFFTGKVSGRLPLTIQIAAYLIHRAKLRSLGVWFRIKTALKSKLETTHFEKDNL